MENKSSELFDKLGLQVSSCNVEEGKTYWIYGCITKFIDDTPGNVIVELNFSIRTRLTIQTKEKVELLKERAFEAGIFVCTMLPKNDQLDADCQTVVFGRKQSVVV
ncbi:MAG: hypothetical protein ACOX2O_03970 [Bdellovibrionota bacterium]|jgi:hypothetical protein